jgi:predicted signal transduction protein with EAL and GGDEF domain
MMSQADMAMYHAKRNGKNSVHVFDDTANNQHYGHVEAFDARQNSPR